MKESIECHHCEKESEFDLAEEVVMCPTWNEDGYTEEPTVKCPECSLSIFV